MITIAWYLLKVVICSGVLCGYYFLALRNKVFHRWNRFYLLATIVIALVVPVMKISIFSSDEDNGTVVRMLQTISYGDEAVVEISSHHSFQLTTENVTEASYVLISAIFLVIFFLSLYRIEMLKKKFPARRIKDISFIETNAKGTPFSFFKNIFWNKAIDIHSSSGQQIFNHEIAHVKEKHSYDKVFMNIVLVFFWINPFFWLMRKELYMIHEFIADKEALEDSDVNAFAEMILHTVYPGQNFSLANNFFYSPLKRRLLMLAKNKNPKVSYISRLLVLPLAAVVFFAFTLKVKNSNTNFYDGKTLTVIIDAGHGGEDNGAHSATGIKEKDINLSIAKKIADLNSNSHFKIILSRDNDQTISVKDRVNFSKKNNADLFISIHLNGAVNEQLNGISVLIDKNKSEQNLLLGSALISQLKKSYKTEGEIGTRTHGVWVLDHNVCPSALVNCGYVTNANDVAFISKSANQDKIAKNILDAINVYASSEENGDGGEVKDNSSVLNDTVPSMYYKGKQVRNLSAQLQSKKLKITAPVIKVTYLDGSTEMISVKDAEESGIEFPARHSLIFINGKKSSQEEMDNIPSENIQSINVLKGEKATDKYGQKGKNGVIEISTKTTNGYVTLVNTDAKIVNGKLLIKDTMPDKVYTKVEVEASFPGGLTAWSKYISRAITDSISKFTKADYGTCVVRFIVDVDGKVSDVVATTMKGTELAKVSINAIKNGPKWIPASQNGHTVAAYRLQPITLQNPDQKASSTNPGSAKINPKNDDGKIFTKVKSKLLFPVG